MTAAGGPEDGQESTAADKEDGSQRQRRRLALAAAALLLTVLLALQADRMSCRCGAGMLSMHWLSTQLFGHGQRPTCPDTPNIILFSLDGGTTTWPWEVAYRRTIVASGVRNANGCRIPMTWFTSCCHGGRLTGECNITQAAHQRGHELSVHTMHHPDDRWMQLGYDELAVEIGGQRAWLVHNCSIPAEAVVGFRAPGFRTNELIGRVLADLGFKYDSSHPERHFTQRGGALNRGFHLQRARSDAPHTWSGLPLWEVPAYKLPGGLKRTDPLPVAGMSILQRLQADFERKRCSGVPVPILGHIRWINNAEHRADVVEFLRWAHAQPNTWSLTYAQYVDWLEAAPNNTNLTALLSKYACDNS